MWHLYTRCHPQALRTLNLGDTISLYSMGHATFAALLLALALRECQQRPPLKVLGAPDLEKQWQIWRRRFQAVVPQRRGVGV